MVLRKKTPRLPGKGPELAHLANFPNEFEINKEVVPESEVIIGYNRRKKNPETTMAKIRRNTIDNVIQQVNQEIMEYMGTQEHNQGGEEEPPKQEEEENENEANDNDDSEEDEEDGDKDGDNEDGKSGEDSDEEDEEEEQGEIIQKKS
ncbi:probable ATP-dependent RNA helicase ddx56 [Papaver somniferum]|uniref:probable ATP-dependent RNA helicase ddx56 n=1 Tax=Papaver somniferum TaxID=3469 RepID=UPI000E701C0C|nr:probable ATP-dependent RNA helicase ddx56 [Papaver somniferum]